MSCVTCYVSCVTCYMSRVTCHLSHVTNASSHYFLAFAQIISLTDIGTDRCSKTGLYRQNQTRLQHKCSLTHVNPIDNLECAHLVIQVGLTNLNNSFGLARAFATWGSKPTSTLKLFWSNGGAKNIKIPHGLDISPTLADLCHILGPSDIRPGDPGIGVALKMQSLQMFL